MAADGELNLLDGNASATVFHGATVSLQSELNSSYLIGFIYSCLHESRFERSQLLYSHQFLF